MVASLKVTRKRNTLKGLLADGGPTTVKVGFPKSRSSRGNIMKAIYNEFGTRGSGKVFVTPRGSGFGGPIPERPFVRMAVKRNLPKYRQAMKDAALALLLGKTSMAVVLARLGALGAQDIKKEAVNLTSPPNSPTTIRLKGSSNPLVDTGEMIGAVTWVRESK